MLNFISKLVGAKSDRDLKKLQPYVDAVNTHAEEFSALSNDQLRGETESFRAAINEATASLESEIAALHKQIQQTEDYDAREPLYEQIEVLDKQVLETVESVLTDIHPRAFALIRETAKRFTAGSVSVQASELDRILAQDHYHITIDGDTATYANGWKAAGGDITWNMVHYDVQLSGVRYCTKEKLRRWQLGKGKPWWPPYRSTSMHWQDVVFTSSL